MGGVDSAERLAKYEEEAADEEEAEDGEEAEEKGEEVDVFETRVKFSFSCFEECSMLKAA